MNNFIEAEVHSSHRMTPWEDETIEIMHRRSGKSRKCEGCEGKQEFSEEGHSTDIILEKPCLK